jgi:uncharacterized protein
MVRHPDLKEDQMTHPNEDLVRGAAAAFERGDMDALRDQYFAADIRWHLPGRSPLAGDYEGVGQVLESFGRLFELTEGTYRTEVHDALGGDEHAVLLFTGRAEKAGRKLEDHTVLTAHIHDGKLTEVWIHPTDLYAFDEFLA